MSKTYTDKVAQRTVKAVIELIDSGDFDLVWWKRNFIRKSRCLKPVCYWISRRSNFVTSEKFSIFVKNYPRLQKVVKIFPETEKYIVNGLLKCDCPATAYIRGDGACSVTMKITGCDRSGRFVVLSRDWSVQAVTSDGISWLKRRYKPLLLESGGKYYVKTKKYKTSRRNQDKITLQ